MQKSAPHCWYISIPAGTTLIWGTTFSLLKDVVTSLSPAILVSSRFLIGTLVLLPFCRHFNGRLFRDGAIWGAVIHLYLCYPGYETTDNFLQSIGIYYYFECNYGGAARLFTGSEFIAKSLNIGRAGIGRNGGLVLGRGSAKSRRFWVFGCALSYAPIFY